MTELTTFCVVLKDSSSEPRERLMEYFLMKSKDEPPEIKNEYPTFVFKDPTPLDLLNGCCPRNRTVLKYMSYGVNL